MVHIREYLISVSAAAILCAILRCLTGEKSTSGAIVNLISGIFLALTLIRPLGAIQLRELSFHSRDILQEADAAVREGTDYAQRAMQRHIKEQTEAYILDKAAAFESDIIVEVDVAGDPPVPVGCTIRGSFSAYARRQLSRYLAEELGIREEDQRWIYENR